MSFKPILIDITLPRSDPFRVVEQVTSLFEARKITPEMRSMARNALHQLEQLDEAEQAYELRREKAKEYLRGVIAQCDQFLHRGTRDAY